MKIVVAAVLIVAVSGCVPEEPTTFATPSGRSAHTVRCIGDSGQCMQKAAATCSGRYQVLDSYSNAGGLVADIIPGPVIWSTLTFACGATDGQIPTFPFRGERMSMPIFPPAPAQIQSNATTRCSSFGDTLTCRTSSY